MPWFYCSHFHMGIIIALKHVRYFYKHYQWASWLAVIMQLDYFCTLVRTRLQQVTHKNLIRAVPMQPVITKHRSDYQHSHRMHEIWSSLVGGCHEIASQATVNYARHMQASCKSNSHRTHFLFSRFFFVSGSAASSDEGFSAKKR